MPTDGCNYHYLLKRGKVKGQRRQIGGNGGRAVVDRRRDSEDRAGRKSVQVLNEDRAAGEVVRAEKDKYQQKPNNEERDGS